MVNGGLVSWHKTATWTVLSVEYLLLRRPPSREMLPGPAGGIPIGKDRRGHGGRSSQPPPPPHRISTSKFLAMIRSMTSSGEHSAFSAVEL